MTGNRRNRDLGVLLPIGAMLLLLPPYISIFDQSAVLGGVPLLPAYVFFAWACAIVLAAWLSRRLLRAEADPGDDEN